MIVTIERLSDLEVSARMFCEGPVCSQPATQRAKYAYKLDGDIEERTDVEVLCDRHVAELLKAAPGAVITADSGPRDTPFHKRIVHSERVPHTRVGNYLDLECGHRVMSFGNLEHAAGVVLCDECRKEADAH